MRHNLINRIGGVFCVLLLSVSVSFATRTRHTAAKSGSTSHTSSSHSGKKSLASSSHKGRRGVAVKDRKKGRTARKVSRGQQGIDNERTREIQEALIRAKYMDGEPSGVFDPQTKSALTKYQSDNGWQTKVLPDSRALIKLGLGPSNSGLLNPESAATSSPHALGTEQEIPGGANSSLRK